MLESLHVRRLIGLTTVFLGLLGLFSSLTLAAVSRPGLSVAFALGGVALAILGLRLLPGSSRPGSGTF